MIFKQFKNQLKGDQMLPNSFNETNITLIPKPKRYIKERELQANIPDGHRYKNFQQNIS